MIEAIIRMARRMLAPNGPAPSGQSDQDPVLAMIPDASMASYVGANTEHFRLVGEYTVGRMRELAGLRPSERVLDIGCGIGRIAVALTQYLDHRGSYVGFDIVEHGIEWCRQRITPRYPRFSFFVADIHNGLYNPRGRHKAVEYRFPLEDGSIDFVLLTSVFTHMPRDEVEHYIDEISRVLDQGGRCFCTAFVLTAERRETIAAGKSGRTFIDTGDGYWVEKSDSPMSAVAFDEPALRAMFESRGLGFAHFAPDDWTTNPWAQDTLVFRKPGGNPAA